MSSSKIILNETGMRDGIQSLSQILPSELKIASIHLLANAGIKSIEVASFVHPKLVPAMADAEIICHSLEKKEGVSYTGLVLNERGLDRALTTPLDHIQSIVYGTDSFAKRNAGQSFEEGKTIFNKIAKKVNTSGKKIMGSIAVAFGCRYEGKVEESVVLDLVKFLLDQDISMLVLADTTGMGNPKQVGQLCEKVLELAGNVPLNLHLHNTENKGYANLFAALKAGVRHFDTAFGGLGGCPFIPHATGNIATEDVVHMLHQMDFETGIDNQQVAKVSRQIEKILAKPLSGMMYKLLDNPDIKINR